MEPLEAQVVLVVAVFKVLRAVLQHQDKEMLVAQVTKAAAVVAVLVE
jgi:hypothetical protein